LPEGEINMDYVKSHLLQYLVGSMVLAITAAVVLGGATYLLLKKRQK
jgi:glycosyltransferase, family 2